jgi:hypothetical protein
MPSPHIETPRPRRAQQTNRGDALMLDVKGCGLSWAIYHGQTFLRTVTGNRDDALMRAEAMARNMRLQRRPCLCCRTDFASEGKHHRLCPQCRYASEGLI